LVKCFSLLFLITNFYCKTTPKIAEQIQPIPDVHDFRSFYTVFHTDSVYQYRHIQFPLEGMPEQNDSTEYPDGFKWNQGNWHLHHAFNEKDSLFRREFTLLDSTLVIETIHHMLSPMRMERRFSYSQQWELIYYSPMRIPIQVEIK
jgi:hypothetical protein